MNQKLISVKQHKTLKEILATLIQRRKEKHRKYKHKGKHFESSVMGVEKKILCIVMQWAAASWRLGGS